MKYSLVIFDWDGTLSDSTGRIVDSMRMAAAHVGLRVAPDSDIQNIIGLGLPEAIQTVWPEITIEQMPLMREAYARCFVYDSSVPMALFPGATDMLAKLSEQGRQLAVATGKSRKGLDRILADLDMTTAFHFTRCADETQSKPHPLMLSQILEAAGVSAKEALMVGDTTYDLQMAATIGMATVGMSHGAHDERRLQACGPEVICHSIDELSNWIEIHG